MQDFYLSDQIVAQLNRDLVGNIAAGAPTGFSAITDMDHLGDEAIFVTLDFPLDASALTIEQYRLAQEIVESALEYERHNKWLYIRLNYAKRMVA